MISTKQNMIWQIENFSQRYHTLKVSQDLSATCSSKTSSSAMEADLDRLVVSLLRLGKLIDDHSLVEADLVSRDCRRIIDRYIPNTTHSRLAFVRGEYIELTARLNSKKGRHHLAYMEGLSSAAFRDSSPEFDLFLGRMALKCGETAAARQRFLGVLAASSDPKQKLVAIYEVCLGYLFEGNMTELSKHILPAIAGNHGEPWNVRFEFIHQLSIDFPNIRLSRLAYLLQKFPRSIAADHLLLLDMLSHVQPTPSLKARGFRPKSIAAYAAKRGKQVDQGLLASANLCRVLFDKELPFAERLEASSKLAEKLRVHPHVEISMVGWAVLNRWYRKVKQPIFATLARKAYTDCCLVLSNGINNDLLANLS